MRDRLLRLLEGVAPALVVGVGLFVAVVGLLPPTVVPADADPSVFSAERAMAVVEVIAADERPIGSPGNAAARAFVAAEMEAMGLEPFTTEQIVPSFYSDEMVPVVNTWALIPGTDPTGGVALMAHIDTEPGSPGANDNATAVAAVLEAGRAVLAGPPLRNDVLLVITDGEEPSQRWGSTVVAESFDGIGVVVNFEAIGGSGPSMVTEVVGDESAMVGAYADAVPRPVVTSFLDDLAELIGGSNTDIAPFRERGVPGIEFAYFHGSPIYHLPVDDVGSVAPGSLQHHGTHALALARAYGEVDLADLRGDDQAVFFSIAGRTVVLYPSWVGVVAAVVLLVMVLGAVWGEVRWGRATWHDLVSDAGWHALVALGVGAGLAVVWRLLVTVLWGDSGPLGLASFVWWVAVAAGTIATTLWWRRRLLRSRDRAVFEWGGLLFWAIVGTVISLGIPGAGYLFVWPALAALVVMVRRSGAASARLGALAVVALPATVLALPVLDVLFQFAQPRPGNVDSQIPEIILLYGLVLALMTLLVFPHWERVRRSG